MRNLSILVLFGLLMPTLSKAQEQTPKISAPPSALVKALEDAKIGFEMEYNREEDAIELALTGGTQFKISPRQKIKLGGKVSIFEREEGSSEFDISQFEVNVKYLATLIEKELWDLSAQTAFYYQNGVPGQLAQYLKPGSVEMVAEALLIARLKLKGVEVEMAGGYGNPLSDYIYEYAKAGYVASVEVAFPLEKFGSELAVEVEMKRARSSDGLEYNQPEVELKYQFKNGVQTYFKWETEEFRNGKFNAFYFGVHIQGKTLKKWFKKR